MTTFIVAIFGWSEFGLGLFWVDLDLVWAWLVCVELELLRIRLGLVAFGIGLPLDGLGLCFRVGCAWVESGLGVLGLVSGGFGFVCDSV